MRILASVLDYPRRDLDQNLFDTTGDEVRLLSNIREEIISIVESFLDDAEISIEESLTDLLIYGSSLTNMWNDRTDVDCRIVLDETYMNEHFPTLTGDELWDMGWIDQGTHDQDTHAVHGILLGNTQHPLNCSIVIQGEMPELGQTKDDPVFDVLKNEMIQGPILEDEDFDPDIEFEEEREEADIVMEKIDKLLREVTTDTIDFELIRDAIGDVKNPEKLEEKLEKKLEEIETDIENVVEEYTDIKEERTKALSEDAKGDIERSRHWAPGNVVFKFIERYKLLDIMRALKRIFKDGVTEGEIEDITKILNIAKQIQITAAVYLYHATLAENLLGIWNEGLKPSEDPHWGGMLGEESYGKIYFSPTESHAKIYGKILQSESEYPQEFLDPGTEKYIEIMYQPEIFMLRILKKDVDIGGQYSYIEVEWSQHEREEALETWTETSIPPENIEILWGEYGWKPLKSVSLDAIEDAASGEWDEPVL